MLAGTEKDVGVDLVKSLHKTKYTVDEKLNESSINFFSQKSCNLKDSTMGDDEDHGKHDNLIEPIDELDTTGSDDESDDSAETGSPRSKDNKHTPAENKVDEEREFHEGRIRRKAVFGNENELDDQEVRLVIFVLIIILFRFAWISHTNNFMKFLIFAGQ